MNEHGYPVPVGAAVAALTDAELVARSTREPAVFVRLFEEHFDSVHRYIGRRLGPDLADDLTAETFVRAFAARASFVPVHDSALPWLYGIATNLVRRHRRTETRRLRAYARAGVDPAAELDTAAVGGRADADRLGSDVAAALASLRQPERDVLLLVALADLTTREAAAALGLPPGTVASRLHRARERVQRRLTAQVPANGTRNPSGERKPA